MALSLLTLSKDHTFDSKLAGTFKRPDVVEPKPRDGDLHVGPCAIPTSF